MRHLLIVGLLCSWIAAVQLKPLHHSMTSSELELLLGARGVEDVPDYEVATPVQIDHKGDYVSHDLTTAHTRARRDEQHLIRDKPAHFEFSAFGERHQMTVKPNVDLLAPGFFMQIYGDNSTVLTDFNLTLCHFVGELTSHSSASHVAISNCQGLMGVVITGNGNTFIQPLPDHLVGSDVNPSNHTHVVYKRAVPASTGGTPPPGFGGADCGVDGSVPKKIYNKAKKLREDIQQGRRQMEDIPDSSGASLGGQYIIEALVVGDTDLYAKHGSNTDQVKRYIITLMNIASSLYNYYNLGFNVRLVLTRIQLFTTYSAQVSRGLYINQNSIATLENFSKWHVKSKPQNSDDPLDYDHAFLFIGRGMCYGENRDCWELGRAWIQGMCSGTYAASINADKGLQIGFVFAHELGHNLAMLHDGADGRCSHEDGYLMKSTTSNAQRIFLFSSCSKDYLMNYLQNGKTQCLRDVPTSWESRFGNNHYNYPGRIYSRDQQCKFSFGNAATYCYNEPDFADPEICEKIWCDDKVYGVCVSTYTGAADGTPCDAPHWRGDRVCHLRRCVPKSEIYLPNLVSYGDLVGRPRSTDSTFTDSPTAVGPTTSNCFPNPRRPVIHGQWNSWSAFTPCGRTCGGGFRYRERQCVKPEPSNCGRDCAGNARDFQFCNPNPCGSDTDIRLQQCRLHNKIKPGIDLVPDYNVPKGEECRLKCMSVSNVKYTFLAAEAPEGTPCNNRTNDRCYFGKCHRVGCDNVYGSRTQYDRCGVCGGNGNSRDCKLHGGSYLLQHQWTGYYDVVVIPARASRITILEKTPSPSITLALSYSSGASIFNGDNKIGPVAQTKTAAGSFFTYNRPGSTVENINSAGPINQPLTLRIRYDRSHGINPGVVYSYDLPKSILVKEETHGWVARRTTCSATCGDGKILTELRCARRSSGIEVDDSRCLGLPNPPRPKERCNAGNCLGRARYLWVSKQWSACSTTCGNGFEIRRIVCRNSNTSKDVDVSFCSSLTRLESSRLCRQGDCTSDATPVITPTPAAVTTTPAVGDWIVGDWSGCSKTCGSGQQTRTVTCSSTTCPDPKPDTKQSCKTANCCSRDKNVKVCKLLVGSNCLTGCKNKVIRKFCCKTCSQQSV